METKVKIIRTEMFTPKTEHILNKMLEYMSSKWGSTQMTRNGDNAKIVKDVNGEITIEVKDRGSWYCSANAYCGRDVNSIKKWFACTLKNIVYRAARYDSKLKFGDYNENGRRSKANFWARGNTKLIFNEFSDNNFTVSIADIYCVFDKLLNRKSFDKKWKKNMLKEIIGEELDPAATELARTIRDEKARIKKELEDDIKQLEKEYSDELYNVRQTLTAKLDKDKADRRAKYNADIAELENALNFSIAV